MPKPESSPIKIKLTPAGGYVMGDGPCPFNPDDFFLLFSGRIIDAKRKSLEELEIPGRLIDQILTAEKLELREMINAVPALEVPTPQDIIPAMDRLLETPPE